MPSDSEMTLLRALQWDSDFFGYAIADWGGSEFSTSIYHEVLQEAKQRGIDCVYVKVGLTPDQATPELSEGLSLVDVKVVLTRPLLQPVADSVTAPDIRLGSVQDLPALAPGLEDLATWSRFASDPRFGVPAAARMYKRWAENACTTDDQMLLIAEDAQGIGGFLALGLNPPEIGLIYSGRSRSGVGTALARRAFLEANGRAPGMTVATQERNLFALQFYRKLGFETTSRTAVYHLWMDQTDA